MVALPTPFEAYQLDLGRLGVDDDLCAADSMWLLVAHCLSRFANQPETARLDLAGRCALALEQFAASAADADTEDSKALDEPALGDLARLIEALQKYGERAGQELLAKTALDMSAQMSALGALTLAHTMVGHARQAALHIPERTRGLMISEQARLMRLLGNLDESVALYAQVHAMGERARDEVLLARAAIGRGVIARVRGNYPSAHSFFTDALNRSEKAGSAELQRLAHQGLFVVAAMCESWDDALRHGWLTLVLGAGNPAHEAEALINLAHVSWGAGFPRAALHAVLKAMSSTTDQRMLLPALGTAVLAAARCDERAMLECLAERMERTVEASNLPFEEADALISLSLAFAQLGLTSRAESARCRAREIAEERGFHELVHKAERTELTRPVILTETRELSKNTREVVAKLETLEYELML